MRYSALICTMLLLSAGVATAQTGFSTKTYPAILSPASDNTKLLSADFNGDGHQDLFSYGSRDASSTVPGNIFLNDGGGGFLAPVPLPGSGMLASAQIGDMNGDGYPDIVGCQNIGSGASQQVSVVVYLNNGSGGFKALPGVTAPGECNALTLGDVYHDGHLDAVTGGYTPDAYGPGGTPYPGDQNDLVIFINDGTGSLQLKGSGTMNLDDSASGSVFTNCGIIDLVGADFQQDGNFDLLLTTTCQPQGQNPPGYAGTVFYAPESSNPSDTFAYSTFQHLQSTKEIYTGGKVADLNGDGKTDALFLGNQNGVSGNLVDAINDGDNSFSFNKLFTSTYFEGAAAADFNSDGATDIATTYDPNVSNGTPAGPPMLTILAGSPGGTFTDSQDFPTGTASDLGGGVIAADLNGDGKPDLATLVYDTSSRTTSLNVYLNTQGGSSSPCSAPSTPNTNIICTPENGATLNSPVTVNAASNISGFTLNRLYLDNQAVYQAALQEVSTSLNAAAGTHRLVLVSYDNSGKAFTYATTFTIGNSTGNGCLPSAPGVSICSPTSGTSYSSPITITAGATAQSGYITAIRVYIDNASVYTSYNPSASTSYQFSEALGVYSGDHHLVIVGYQSTGGAVTNSLYFNVPSTPCEAPTGGASIRLCSPNETITDSSPITVSAAAYTSTGYVTAMRIYIDNVAVALLNNPQKSQAFTISQSEPISAGKHNLVVVAYFSGGGSASSEEEITVQ